MTRPKPRRNPSGDCVCCGIKIFNKQRSAMYCEEDAKLVQFIRQAVSSTIFRLKKTHKIKVNIRYRIDIRKRGQAWYQ